MIYTNEFIVSVQTDHPSDPGIHPQYQKRFLELYNEVAAKHRQTKQFYTLYNTLEDKRRYLEKVNFMMRHTTNA
jgi:hypothetical protein